MKSAQWKLSTVFCVDRNKCFNYVAPPRAGCHLEDFQAGIRIWLLSPCELS